MHVVARPGINSIEDLNGKKVNFHTPGSSTALTGPRIFKELHVDVQPVNVPQGDALQRMRAGEIDATVCVCAKPVTIYADLRQDAGFKLLDIPFAAPFQDDLLPVSIGPEDYPSLVAKGMKVESVATTTVLVTFNWARGSTRYNRTAKFVDALFSKFSELQKPPRHPMWKSVNIAATVPGMQRFPAAQEWLDRSEGQAVALRGGLGKILSEDAASKTRAPSPADADKLFREFM